jgi:RNA polymerase sigma-70 factor, ECF subfamily
MDTTGGLEISQSAPWGTVRIVEDARDLVLAYYDRENVALRRYLMFLGMDADAARETVQETFLKLHEHVLANGDRTNLRAWLYRVAHNLARNTQASFQTRKMDPLENVTVARVAATDYTSADDELLAKERLLLLRQAFNQLSTVQRELLVL